MLYEDNSFHFWVHIHIIGTAIRQTFITKIFKLNSKITSHKIVELDKLKTYCYLHKIIKKI